MRIEVKTITEGIILVCLVIITTLMILDQIRTFPTAKCEWIDNYGWQFQADRCWDDLTRGP